MVIIHNYFKVLVGLAVISLKIIHFVIITLVLVDLNIILPIIKFS
jgi:hypothetical protein